MREMTDKDVDVDVDVLVIGAGVVGIYALQQAVEAGFSAQTLEAGDGVGGVWYWNRYPSARFDSESYAYAYIHSKELFTGWKWQEEFATQPEIESYLNFAVDHFDLRGHIRTGERVVSAVWQEAANRWELTTAKGELIWARWVISATGGLSVPNYPDLEGLETFSGQALHTGAWPHTPVDFEGKRVAIIGNGPSGAQLLPAIVDTVEYVDLYQRTPTWTTPLNNTPITAERQTWLREHFEEIAAKLGSPANPTGFLHEPAGKFSTDDSPEERQVFFEKVWNSPGFAKLTTNYYDLTTNREINLEFCEFLANKVRSIVADPETAERLIPKDHLFGAKRPPFVTNYYESFNKAAASLISLKETPIVRADATGIETTAGHRDYDIIVFATGFDFGTGALTRMGVKGLDGLDLSTDWEDGPSDFAGFSANRMPNFFFPGGPHGAGGGNYPRYSQDQIDWITGTMVYAREHGYDRFEPTGTQQEAWMAMVETLAPLSIFSAEHSHYYGANVEGKVRKFLLNPGGRAKLHEMLAEMTSTENYGGALSTVHDRVSAV
ncbi:flavin-containing monooxygenase [Arthrobacter sunyaminii]|uniref:NAD(P)/FAD-dependent oxidoreductase n=1 Tax=Arthrobacter sunyaminii TaxID=2816859 RepID=A0A975XL05_9MICC|nr:NAD(P)/FAD-dependent oxidoreductase [Arthrobacter sunyaminii]MBO0909834.1 NAD(P)/FAD-dependent oxidoreductase [Arthrobacter sunyaminii]QWQ36624.1 NAD(P)/FAD-dependent oxidoreductase [Arthrobacter sunyaminii]